MVPFLTLESYRLLRQPNRMDRVFVFAVGGIVLPPPPLGAPRPCSAPLETTLVCSRTENHPPAPLPTPSCVACYFTALQTHQISKIVLKIPIAAKGRGVASPSRVLLPHMTLQCLLKSPLMLYNDFSFPNNSLWGFGLPGLHFSPVTLRCLGSSTD